MIDKMHKYKSFWHCFYPQPGCGRGCVQLLVQHGVFPVLHLHLHEDHAGPSTQRPGPAHPSQVPRAPLPDSLSRSHKVCHPSLMPSRDHWLKKTHLSSLLIRPQKLIAYASVVNGEWAKLCKKVIRIDSFNILCGSLDTLWLQIHACSGEHVHTRSK